VDATFSPAGGRRKRTGRDRRSKYLWNMMSSSSAAESAA